MKMDIDFPDDFLSQLLASDFEEIATEALKEAVPELEKSVKSGCRSVIKDETRTELVDSIKTWDKVVHTKTDAFMLGVAFTGKPKEETHWSSKSSKSGKIRKKTTSNNDIAWWLEHGNAHQAPKPFIDKSSESVRNKIMDICQKVYNKKVGTK